MDTHPAVIVMALAVTSIGFLSASVWGYGWFVEQSPALLALSMVLFVLWLFSFVGAFAVKKHIAS